MPPSPAACRFCRVREDNWAVCDLTAWYTACYCLQVLPGEDYWAVCNRHGATILELQKLNKGVGVWGGEASPALPPSPAPLTCSAPLPPPHPHQAST